MAHTTTTSITEGDLVALRIADAAVARADRHLEAAKTDREEVRARLRRRLPEGALIEVTGTGQGITRRVNQGARTFSLVAYERAHGKLTPEMSKIVKRSKGAEVWAIEDLDV